MIRTNDEYLESLIGVDGRNEVLALKLIEIDDTRVPHTDGHIAFKSALLIVGKIIKGNCTEDYPRLSWAYSAFDLCVAEFGNDKLPAECFSACKDIIEYHIFKNQASLNMPDSHID